MADSTANHVYEGAHPPVQGFDTWIPSEILLEIFYVILRLHDLLRCQMVCKRFRRLIQESIRLRYMIELAVANCTDKHAHDRADVSECLEALKRRQIGWKEGKFKFRTITDWPGDPGLLRAHDARAGMLACAFADDENETLYRILAVRSLRLDSERPILWSSQVDQDWSSFTMDPSQDLLVLWKKVSGWLHMQLLHLSDGSDYFRAWRTSSCLQLNGHHDPESFQIRGCLFLILDTQSSVLFDWMTGNAGVLGIGRFSALLVTERCLVAFGKGNSSQSSVIDVFFIRKTETSVKLAKVAQYELPEIAPGKVVSVRWKWVAGSGFSLSPVSSAPADVQPPFTTRDGLYILAFTMEIDRQRTYTCLMRAELFDDTVRNYLASSLVTSSVSQVPWKSWGPRSTWWFETHETLGGEPDRSLAQFQYGTRIVISGELIDVNQLDVKRDLCRQTNEPDANERASDETTAKLSSMLESGTSPPSAVHDFCGGIETTAPFRRTKIGDTRWAIPDEDLVYLRMDDDMRGFDVYEPIGQQTPFV